MKDLLDLMTPANLGVEFAPRLFTLKVGAPAPCQPGRR